MDSSTGSGKPNLVTVPTDQLRQRLNRLYSIVRTKKQTQSIQSLGRFDYLWDLKELAVLEGKRAVEIPDAWLDELEQAYSHTSSVSGRGH